MKTLARYIQEKREKLGMSASGLASRCHLDVSFIEAIEEGQELFLPVTIRQNIAKALRVSPIEIKVLEKDINTEFVSKDVIDVIKQRILNGETELDCPKCGAPLTTRIAKMYDLEDNLMLHPKAHCTKCVFQIHD